MNKLRYITLVWILGGFLSCSPKEITDTDINNFISKYQNESFDNMRDISVFQRSADFNEIVYGVGSYSGNQPLYFVTYNLAKKSIVRIDRSLIQKKGVKDYLTEREIANAVNTIRKHNFFLLSVDSSKNVFINPYNPNEPAYFLRLKVETGDSVISMGYAYRLFKKNWYLNMDK